jgi:glycerophosphoryl diester phosphodiesterase
MKTLFLKIVVLLTTNLCTVSDSQTYENWPEWSVVSVAHRGGIVPGIPENTLRAFRESIKIGVHAIEVDLRGTKDGAVVIMHDKEVDRTTNGKGKVEDLTLTELKKFDAGQGERIPTYEEVLKIVSGTGVSLLLDIKTSSVLNKSKVVRLTEKYNAVLNVIVGTRSIRDLKEFQTLNPNLRTLGFIQKIEDIEPFVQSGVDIIRLWPEWIRKDPGLIKKVQQFGKPAWTTAGNALCDELEILIKLGVNGILSDNPKRMNSMFNNIDKDRNH